jgi:hypothetical protein
MMRWLSVEEGGRRAPPRGPVFGAIASFVGRDGSDFSIVLRYREGAPGPGSKHPCDVRFLAPELVLPHLRVGSELLVKEGARPIGMCTIERLIE